MFVQETKAAFVAGLKATFDSNYPQGDFRDLKVSLEYPAAEVDYPGIWVDFEPEGPLKRAGVNHREYSEQINEDDPQRAFTRWRFAGMATMTIIALTSRERDRLVDEVIRIMAFPRENAETQAFRNFVEDNPLIGMNVDFDQIFLAGKNEAMGTPWGTDQVIYEQTIQMQVIGEFVSDMLAAELVPLAEVGVYVWNEDVETDQTDEEDGDWT